MIDIITKDDYKIVIAEVTEDDYLTYVVSKNTLDYQEDNSNWEETLLEFDNSEVSEYNIDPMGCLFFDTKEELDTYISGV